MNFVDMNMDMGNPRCIAGGGQIVEIWKSNLWKWAWPAFADPPTHPDSSINPWHNPAAAQKQQFFQ